MPNGWRTIKSLLVHRLKFSIFFYLPKLLFCAVVSAALFAERVS